MGRGRDIKDSARRVPKAGHDRSGACLAEHAPYMATISLKPTNKVAEKTLIDLAFTNSGCRKTITNTWARGGTAPKCEQQLLCQPGDIAPSAARGLRTRPEGLGSVPAARPTLALPRHRPGDRGAVQRAHQRGEASVYFLRSLRRTTMPRPGNYAGNGSSRARSSTPTRPRSTSRAPTSTSGSSPTGSTSSSG